MSKDAVDEWESRTKRMIRTEDGWIIDGRRTIVRPYGKRIPLSELIGATITELNDTGFMATISEKTIRAEFCSHDGFFIETITIDAGDKENLKAIKMNLEDWIQNDDEDNDEY
jgi:hypothetical protein